jgi:hypothetical protein
MSTVTLSSEGRRAQRGGPGMKGRAIAFLATAVAAASVLAVGIFREEIGEVMFNAAML